MTLSSLAALIKGLLKSTQNAAFDNTHVLAFQAVAANEISTRWEVEMAYKDAGINTNTTVIAAALDPRFCRLKFLSPDESLQLQLKVQALALEAKRRVMESQQPQHTIEGQTSAGVTEKRSVSLLDTLLGSDSEETSSQNDSGDEADVISHSVREEILKYFGDCLKVQILCSGGKQMRQGFPLWLFWQSHICVYLQHQPLQNVFSP